MLAAYGADRTRWPAPERRRLSDLRSDDPALEQELADEAALDRLLSQATPPPSPSEDALSRLLERARSDEPEGGAEVVPFRRRSPTPGRPAVSRMAWPAAALMAASLLLGIAIERWVDNDFAYEANVETAFLDQEDLELVFGSLDREYDFFSDEIL